MPWVDYDSPGPQGEFGAPQAVPEPPTPRAVSDAGWVRENEVVSLVKALARSRQFTDVPGHNPLDTIRGTPFAERHLDRFEGSTSPEQDQAIMAQITEEEKNEQILDAAGWLGTLSRVTSGLTSPTVFLPGGAIYRTARGGVSIARSAAAVGAAAGAQVGVQEALLQSTQLTRPLSESAMNIGTATLFGAIIGAGASRLISGAERKAFTALLQRERDATDAHVSGVSHETFLAERERVAAETAANDDAPLAPVRAADVGAAATDTRDLEQVGFGLNKIPGWSRIARFIGTDLGIYSSQSVEARRLMSETASTTLRFKQNVPQDIIDPATGQKIGETAGEVTSPVVPLDQEVRLRMEQAQIRIGDEMTRLYSRYFFGDENATAPVLRGEIATRFGESGGKLSPAEFDAEIVTAMNKGDTHAIPEVQEAAQFLRREVLDPYANKMEAANPNFKKQEFKEGESYFPYNWDKAKIAAHRPEYVDTVAAHLKADQAVKAAAKQRLEWFNGQLNSWDDQVAKFERRLETLDAADERLEARLSERAMEVSRTEQRAGALDERAATIAETVSEIEDFARAMREELTDPALRERLDRLEADARRLARDDRPMTEAQLRKIEEDELGGILTGPVRKAAEILTGRRNPPKAPSFISWIIENGGLKDDGGDLASMIGGPRARPGLISRQGRQFDELGNKIQSEFRGAFPELDITGWGAPDRDMILGWIDDEMRSGKRPDWWVDAMSRDNPELVEAGRIAAALDEAFGRADIEVKTVRDVAKVFRDARDAPMTLADLDRRVAEMEAAGAGVPPSLERQAASEALAEAQDGVRALRALVNRAKAAKAASERRLGMAEARTGEAEFGARQNRGRLGVLQTRLEYNELKREVLNDALEIARFSRDDVRGKIEEEIAAWEGKSAGEAKSALRAREAQDKKRMEAGTSTGRRLTSADNAVDATVRRIIDSNRDLSDIELRDKAEEITDHVLGTPVGRFDYDSAATVNEGPRRADRSARGPLHVRDFAVPYDIAKPWLSHDLNQSLGNWLRTMVPDTALWERFPGEGPAMTSRYRAIQEEYAALARAAKSAKERTALNKEKDNVIATIDGVVQRIRGTANNTVGLSGRIGENVRRINQMADLGFAAITSIPDFAGPVLYHGLMNTFGDGWAPYASYLAGNPDLARMSKQELRAAGIAVEIENTSRGNALAETTQAYHPQTKAERALKWASDRFFLLNMQAQETNAAKRIAGRVAGASLLRAIEAEVAGKATQKQVVALRESNISPELSRRIWDQFNADGGGVTIDGTYLPNTNNWVDEGAKTHYLSALLRDVDRAVVTPGQEKPLWLSTNAGALLAQYKGFTIAATNKLLISGLQRADAATLQGVLVSVALGVMSYRLATLLRGQEWPERPQDVIKEGLNRSGILAGMEEVNMFAAKMSGGVVDWHRLYGADKPLSRNTNRTILSSVLGPTAGKIENINKVTSAVGRGDWNESDTRALRRLIALQNVWGLNWAFDGVERGFNNAFGIEMRERPN